MSWIKAFSGFGTVHKHNRTTNIFEPLILGISEIQIWCIDSRENTGKAHGEIRVFTEDRFKVLMLPLIKVLGIYQPSPQEPSWFVFDLHVPGGINKYGFKITDTKQHVQDFRRILNRLWTEKDSIHPEKPNDDIYDSPLQPVLQGVTGRPQQFTGGFDNSADEQGYNKLQFQPSHFQPMARKPLTSNSLVSEAIYSSMVGMPPQVDESEERVYESISQYEDMALVKPKELRPPELPPRRQMLLQPEANKPQVPHENKVYPEKIIPTPFTQGNREKKIDSKNTESSLKVDTQMGKVSEIPDSVPSPAFNAENPDILCDMLAEAIDAGNVEEAAKISAKLAKRKLKVTIQALFSVIDDQPTGNTINITVQVEDRLSDGPTLIKLDVDPNSSIGKLKYMVQQVYGFPIKVQRWVVGKRLPEDGENLSQLNVTTTGTVVFLYLLSAKEAVDRPSIQHQDSPEFKLPPRDYPANLPRPPQLGEGRPQYISSPAVFSPYPNPFGQSVPRRDFHSVFEASPVQQQRFPMPLGLPYYSEKEKLGYASPAPVPGRMIGGHSRLPTSLPTVDHSNYGVSVAPKPSGKPTGWACPSCTLVNLPTRPGCEACATPRPEDYRMPAEFVLDLNESHRLMVEDLQEQMAFNCEEARLEEERKRATENFLHVMATAQKDLISNAKEFECPICLAPIAPNEGVTLRECLHEVCKECLRMHVNQSEDPEVKCPFTDGTVNCAETITAQEIRAILGEEEYMKFLQKSVNAAENKAPNSYHCKTVNCIGWCLYEDEVNWFPCQVCGKQNCLTCKAIHDNMTCQEYQDDLKIKANNDVAAKITQLMLEELVRKGDAMKCPECAIILQKKDGCDWMRCSMCKTEICWATKGRRWGPKGNGDTSAGCQCTSANRCHPNCGNCH